MLEIYEASHDFENELLSIKRITRIYTALNKSNEAISLLIKKLNEQQGNKEKECVLLERIGITFKEIKNSDKALIYLLQAEEKSKEVVKPSSRFNLTLLTIYKNIGVLYRNKDDFDKAIYYFDKGYDLAETTKNVRYKGIILNSLAILYREKKEYLKAIEAFEELIKLKLEVENSAGVSNSYSNLAALYLEIKNYSKAEKNYQLAYTIAVQSKQKKAILEVCEGFYRFYDKLNKPSLAYPYLKRAFILKDSIYSSSIAEESAKLETIYNTEKKQKEIEIGKIKNQQLEKDVKSKDRERNIFIGSALLLGLFLILSVRSFLQKKKVNKQFEEKNSLINKQKLLVEEKQKEVLDSIRYAKKIQQALLTSEGYINKNINRLLKK